MRRTALIALTLTVTSVGGCATAKNVQRVQPEPFGGTTMKCHDFYGGGQNGGFAAAGFWPLWLLDKPFSVVGDCVTLPYVLWKHGRESFRLLVEREQVPIKSDGPPAFALPPAQTCPLPGVIGKPVGEARRFVENHGFLFVWRDGPDGFPMCAAQYQRVEVEVKSGVVTSARSFSGKPWP